MQYRVLNNWRTTQSAANPSRRQIPGNRENTGDFSTKWLQWTESKVIYLAKSAPCLTNSLLTATGNASVPISENPGSISEAGEAFQRICCEWAFIVVRGEPDP